MKVVNVQAPQTFQGLNYRSDLPEMVKKTIETSNALKKFGEKYNADIDFIHLKSSKNKSTHPAFLISNIIPKGIQKLIDKFKGVDSKNQFMYLSTHGHEDADLYNKYTKVAENYVIKTYQKTFNSKKIK